MTTERNTSRTLNPTGKIIVFAILAFILCGLIFGALFLNWNTVTETVTSVIPGSQEPEVAMALAAQNVWRGAEIGSGCETDPEQTTSAVQEVTGLGNDLTRLSTESCTWIYSSTQYVTIPALGPDWVITDYSTGLGQSIVLTEEVSTRNFRLRYAPGFEADASAEDVAQAAAEQAVAEAQAVDEFNCPSPIEVAQAYGYNSTAEFPVTPNGEICGFFVGPNLNLSVTTPTSGYLSTIDPVGEGSSFTSNIQGTYVVDRMTIRVAVEAYRAETIANMNYDGTFECDVWHKEAANGFLEDPQFEVINRVAGCEFDRAYATFLVTSSGGDAAELAENGYFPQSSVECEAEVIQAVNYRAGASTNDTIRGSRAIGYTSRIIGRNEDGTWVQWFDGNWSIVNGFVEATCVGQLPVTE